MCRKFCYLICFVLLAGLAVTNTADAVGDPNLVGYWKLDESWGHIAADVAGHDYDCDVEWTRRLPGDADEDGFTWMPTDGNIGGALRFGDSNSSYAGVSDMDDANYCAEAINPDWSEGTVAMWMKLRDPQTANSRSGTYTNVRMAHGTGSGGRRKVWFDDKVPPANSRLHMGAGDNFTWKTNITTLTLEQWYHVAFTWDNYMVHVDDTNGWGIVYVDGNSVKTGGYYTGMTEFPSSVLIGNSGSSSGSGEAFCGMLDDVALWNIEKTESEIVAIFKSPTGVTQPTFPRATEPSPGRGDFEVPPEPNLWPDPNNLSWKAGTGAVASHDVYFGTDHNDVRDANNSGSWDEFKGNQLVVDCNFDPGILTFGQKYYWRIDEQPGPVTGRVWSFTIDDNKATDPDPEDDDTPSASDQTSPDANLSWLPGAYAGSHKVYLGTNEQDVNDANESSAEYMGTGTYPCFDPEYADPNRQCYNPAGDLTMGQTYYWRVDEVNSVYGTATGDIWGFKVYQHIVIDDFEIESYVDNTDLRAVWTAAEKAASVQLAISEEDEADDSNQSMRLVYKLKHQYHTGDPNYAEAYRTVANPDLTKGGLAKAISLWYRSEPPPLKPGCNTFEFGDVYVTLEDKSGGDTDTVRLSDEGEDPCINAEWHEWNIDLRDFNNPDLDITNIDKIHLGVGDGTTYGVGYMYFDEIREYSPRCVADLVVLDGDINEDCVVDFEDIEDMGDDWLNSDSNSIGLDGVLDPDAFLSPGGWVVDPCRGNSLRFDGHMDTPDDSNDWVDIDDYLLPRFQNRTIMAWVRNKSDDQEESWRVHIFSSSSYTIGLSIGATSTREGRLEGQVEDCKMTRIENSDLDVNDWHHVALVLGNKSGDDYVYCELYLDGAWIADNLNPGTGGSAVIDEEIPRHTGTRLPNANIGSYEDGESRYIQATIDNFRIYDYNMPAAHVDAVYQLEKDDSTQSYNDANLILWYKFDETSGYIAEDSGRDKDNHLYHPMNSSANIVEKELPKPPYDPDNKDIVNFVDYGVLADNWLVEKLWPEP